jgi:hypothetical protein
MKRKEHIDEPEEITSEPEAAEEAPTVKVSGIDGIKCGSSNRLASYNSDTGELVISQNGIVVATDTCRSEEHARVVASRF